MVRVLIAAAESSLRNALKLMLCRRLPIDVMDEAGDCQDLKTSLAELQPDLLLVDWALPEFRNPAQLPAYQSLVPHMHIVALSVTSEEIAGVLAAGAHACLLSGASPECLLGLLRPIIDTLK